MTQVYLLRHGIAEEGKIGSNDADRALTQEGRRKLQHVLASAAEAGVQPGLILSSPFKRALQTAEIAKDVLGHKDDVLQTNVLTPGANPEDVWDEIRIHKDVGFIAAGRAQSPVHVTGRLFVGNTGRADRLQERRDHENRF